MSRGTWDTSRRLQNFAYGAFTLYDVPFQALPLSLRLPYQGPATPLILLADSERFRLFPFRSPLLGESHAISFPWLTEMFQLGQLALLRL